MLGLVPSTVNQLNLSRIPFDRPTATLRRYNHAEDSINDSPADCRWCYGVGHLANACKRRLVA
jgi:hypothetical protein